jgi:hypothetical protein
MAPLKLVNMKKIITIVLMLIGTITMFPQSTTIKGTSLKYDKEEKTMTLTIDPKTMTVNDDDLTVSVEIFENFFVTSYIDGSLIWGKPIFSRKGHIRGMELRYVTILPEGTFILVDSYNIMIKEYYVYQFNYVKPNEYFLVVRTLCDNKYVTDEEVGLMTVK